jgi:phosphoribosylaminoimidazolecarboxamide formyltransferase / IMP cyclohydrolase
LAQRTENDENDMKTRGYDYIDYVICNLYPFEKTIRNGCSIDEAVEEIDIGGVTLLRAAAKNHKRVLVLTDPNDYITFINELKENVIHN